MLTICSAFFVADVARSQTSYDNAVTPSVATPHDTTADDLTLTGTASGDFSGVIFGSGSLAKTGSGDWTLSAANTLTGSTTLSGGTLRAGAANVLSSASTVFVNNNATLDLAGFDQTVKDLDSYNAGTGQFDPGTVLLGGATLTNLNSATNNWAGSLQGTGTFIKQGAAEMKWYAANTFTGTLQIDAGSLSARAAGVLSPNATVTVASGATLDLNHFDQTVGSIAGTGTVAVGGGTLTMTSARVFSDSAFTFDGGKLVYTGGGLDLFGSLAVPTTATIQADSSVRLSSTVTTSGGGILTKAGTGQLSLLAPNTLAGLAALVVNGGSVSLSGSNDTLPSVTLASGTSMMGNSSNVTFLGLAGSGTVNLGGTLSDWFELPPPGDDDGGGGALGGGGGAPLDPTIHTPNYFIVRQDADTTFSGTIGGVNRLVKEGTGTLTLTDSNTFYEGVSLRAGTLAINGDSALGYAGYADTDAGYTAPGQSYLRFVANRVAFEGGTLRALNSFATDRLAEFPGNGTIEVDAAAALTWNGALSGTGTLTKSGAGTLTFGGAVSIGGLNVQAGTAALTTTNQLATLNQITIASGATLDATNLAQTFAQLNGAGALTLGNGALTVANGGAFGGTIATSSGVTLTGGTLTLSGANTYTGGTTISAGTLQLGAGGTSGSLVGSVSVASGATLAYDHGANDVTSALNVSGAGGVVKYGSGNLTVTGNNSFTGELRILAGTLTPGPASFPDGAGPVFIDAGATLIGNGLLVSALTGTGTVTADGSFFRVSGSSTFGGSITGASGLQYEGTGTLILTGTSDYTGGTRITSGTLQIGNGGSTGSLTGNISNDGALIFNRSGGVSLAGDITGAGTLTKTGAGTLTLSGANTYAGGTTVSGGLIEIDTDSRVGPGALTLDGGGIRYGAAFDNLRGFTVGSGATLDTNGFDVTYGHALSGTGVFTKSGAGTLTLSVDSTLSGGTTIAAGTLQLGAGGATGTLAGDVSVAAGATLSYDHGANDFTSPLAVSGGGGVTKLGAGNLTVTGSNTFAGELRILAGTFTPGWASFPSGAGPVFVESGATLVGGGLAVASLTGSGTVQFDGADFVASSGSFAGVLQGAAGLEKNGAGTLTLSGANTYSGGTSVSAGTLQLGADGALPDGTALTVTGGTLDLAGHAFTTSALSGTGGTVALGSATLTANQSVDTTFWGAISGGGAFSKSGAGTLTLSGTSTYGGATTISAGKLQLGVNHALPTGAAVSVADGASLDLNGFEQTIASVGGTGAVTIGSGTLTIANAGSNSANAFSFAGGKLVAAGSNFLELEGNLDVPTTATIQTDSSVRFIAATTTGGGTLTKAGTGQLSVRANSLAGLGALAVDGGSVNLTEANTTLPALTVATGASVTSAATGVTLLGVAGSGTVDLGGTLNDWFSAGPPGDETSSGGSGSSTALTIHTPNYLVVRQDTDSTFSGTIAGVNRLTKEGAGTLTLTGSNTFYEGVSLGGGTLAVGGDAALGYAGFADPGLNEVGNRVSFEGGTLRALASFSTSRLAVFAGNGGIEVDAGKSLTWNGEISGSGTLDKTGAGTLTVNGVVAIGGLNVQAGTAALTSTNQLATLSQITIASGATLDATNLAQTFAQLNGAGALTLGNGALTVANGGAFGGTIATSSGVTLTGGTLTLSGANTYTGGTTISAGTLQLGAGGTTGSITGSVSVASGATLAYDHGANDFTSPLDVSGDGGLTKLGAGNLTVTGSNTFTGELRILGGTLTPGPASFPAGAAAVFVDAGATLIGSGLAADSLTGTGTVQFDGAAFQVINSGSFGGALTGTGSLQKHGAGTLTLSGANTYSGGTTITGGTLALGHANGVGTGGSVTVDAGAIFDTAAFGFDLARIGGTGTATGTGGFSYASASDHSLATVLAGSGGLLKTGSGTLVLSAANTYTGATTINSGTLALGSAGSLASSSISVAGGATFDVSVVAGGFTLASGRTFGGTGSVAGVLTAGSGAHLAPGNSPGTLTFADGLTLLDGSILDFQLGSTSDRIAVTGGTLTGSPSAGGITLNLSDAGGFGAGTYTLFDFTNASTSGFDVTDFVLGTTIANFNYSFTLTGSTLSLTATSAIPEPSTYALLFGVGALGVAAGRRKIFRGRRCPP